MPGLVVDVEVDFESLDDLSEDDDCVEDAVALPLFSDSRAFFLDSDG